MGKKDRKKQQVAAAKAVSLPQPLEPEEITWWTVLWMIMNMVKKWMQTAHLLFILKKANTHSEHITPENGGRTAFLCLAQRVAGTYCGFNTGFMGLC